MSLDRHDPPKAQTGTQDRRTRTLSFLSRTNAAISRSGVGANAARPGCRTSFAKLILQGVKTRCTRASAVRLHESRGESLGADVTA